MGLLDRGWVQAGHIASPGMLQPLLVSAGDEEQVKRTYLLENTDRQTDKSQHFVAAAFTVVIVVRQRERDKSRQERKGYK